MVKKTSVSKIDEMERLARIDNSRQDNTSRSRIAYAFAFGFVGIIAFILFFGPIYNVTIGKNAPVDVQATLASFMSQFGTPLGFVLGYYFKDKPSNE